MNEAEEDSISVIQQWLKTQRFLPKNLSTAFIKTFMTGCDGNVRTAKTVIGNYFYARQSIPELFSNRDPLLEENIKSWKSSCFIPLEGKQNGCKVFVGAAVDSKNYNFTQFGKQMFMCFDLLIKDNKWENGDRILIISYDKIRDSSTYTFYITRKVAECQSESFLPGKLKAIHNINIHLPFMKKILDRFKPFMNKKERKVITFHKNLRNLHRYVSPKILPLEFGGKAESLSIMKENWYKILKENRQFFVEEEEKRMQELKIGRV